MITLSLLAVLYFLPTILAARRGHSILLILLLNLFFGWTGVVWFALLLWAICSSPRYCYAAPYPRYPRYYYPPNYYPPYYGPRNYPPQ